jgi:hypothetical protein
LKFFGEVIADFLVIVQNFNAVATVGVFSRLDDPPAVFGTGILERLEFFMSF